MDIKTEVNEYIEARLMADRNRAFLGHKEEVLEALTQKHALLQMELGIAAMAAIEAKIQALKARRHVSEDTSA